MYMSVGVCRCVYMSVAVCRCVYMSVGLCTCVCTCVLMSPLLPLFQLPKKDMKGG